MITILLAGVISLALTLFATPPFIKFLRQRQYGQFVRLDGVQEHLVKRGTPTMGGVVIVASTVAGYLGAHLLTWRPVTASAVILLALVVSLALLGFMDDWSKIKKERSLGLTARGKLIGQALIGGLFAFAVLNFPDVHGVTPGSQYISFLRDIPWLYLAFPVAILFIMFLVAAWSNAVNITDGLDGLATGSCSMVFGAYALITVWQFNQWCSKEGSIAASCYQVRDPYDLAVVAIALAGACFGFLWFNARPAQIFMGDTGSLALGGALAGLSVMTRTELLTVILGALFVMEAGSVAIQVAYFKATGGKRIFKMTPIHHTFELMGWKEVTIVIRFWIICGCAVTIAMFLFYAEWMVTQ